MPPASFARVIPATERPQTYAVDRKATGIGIIIIIIIIIIIKVKQSRYMPGVAQRVPGS